MKFTGIYLFDQSAIQCSDNALSLYINGVHIAEADDYETTPVEGIADAIGEALAMPVNRMSILPEALARIISGEEPLSREDAQESVAGYSDDDVMIWLEEELTKSQLEI